MANHIVAEVKCPKCDSYATMHGGILCVKNDKLMIRQYRRCNNDKCGYRFVTYKDKETDDIYLNDEFLTKGKTFYK